MPGICPVAEAVADAAGRPGHPEFDRLAAELTRPVRIGVRGRPGAGVTTVERALRGVGAGVAQPGCEADIEVYVFVETLTPEDRAAVSVRRPTVAVLNKADLAGFGGLGPMSTAQDRCRMLTRDSGVPAVALAGLLAAAAAPGLEPDLLQGLVALAHGRRDLEPGIRQKLLAELDLFGVATAVAAIRDGTPAGALSGALRRVSGLDRLAAEIDRAAAPVRYRRAVAGLTRLGRLAAGSRVVAEFLAGDEVGNTQQRRDRGVAPALFDDAEARINEHDGEIRRGGARHHVARVLDVPRGVRDDELPARRREIAIGHIDRDALFAFGAEAVGEVGEINLTATGDIGGALECFDLILHQRF